MSNRHQRAGLSRIDVVVIVLMLGLSLGLLVPAVEALQFAGYRQATVNSVKHIGIAIHSANDAYKRLPPACDKFANWQFAAPVHVHLLPYIEQDALYRAYQNDEGKGVPAEVSIAVFMAADDNSNVGDKVKGVQNFAANLRVFADKGMRSKHDKDLGELKAVEPGNARIPATFQDGTSNTIIFATKYAASADGGSRYAADPSSKFAAFFGQNAAQKPAHPSDASATYQMQPAAKDARVTPLMAQSFTKSLLVGLADGSVRTVGQELTAETWNRALHPSDGNILGADW